MARLFPTPYPIEEHDDWHEMIKADERLFIKLTRQTLDLPDGEIVGALVSFPYADGSANYVVTAARPLTLQHIPSGDAWQIPAAHMRGLCREDILDMVTEQKAWSAMLKEQAIKNWDAKEKERKESR